MEDPVTGKMEGRSPAKIKVHKVPLADVLSDKGASLDAYRGKVFGKGPFWHFLRFELLTFLFANVSGGLGYLLRRYFYKYIFNKIGKQVIIGPNITIRHPRNISIADRVAMDEGILLDAGGPKGDRIEIEEEVVISRNCVIQTKFGLLKIGSRTNIGCYSILSSASGISIGRSVLIAGNCYIGGGKYIVDDLNIPIMDQGLYSQGPVVIGDGSWLGAGVIILDGVRIGMGCIIGAGAVVTKDIPDFSVVVGVPGRIVKMRNG